MNNTKEMKKYLESLSLADYEKEKDEWDKIHSLLVDKNFTLGKKKTDNRKQQEQIRLNQLLKETGYVEPEYPAIGVSGSDGACVFSSHEQAKELIQLLVWQSYHYGHDLIWSGPGQYFIETQYKKDHDKETVYTAVYKIDK
jgi:hypothetical protein